MKNTLNIYKELIQKSDVNDDSKQWALTYKN